MSQKMAHFLSLVKLCLYLSLGWPCDGFFTTPPTGGGGSMFPATGGGDFTFPSTGDGGFSTTPTTGGLSMPLSGVGGFTITPVVEGEGISVATRGTTSFPTTWSSGRARSGVGGRLGPARRARLRLLTRDDDIHYGSMSDKDLWGYHGPRGYQTWKYVYPSCGKNAQSPININTERVIVAQLAPLQLKGYGLVTDSLLENIEHSVQVRTGEHINEVSGGGLPGNFILETFHFHWCLSNSQGSEHTINFHRFPMEMHMVHYNKRYGSFGDAKGMQDGTAVLAFFFKTGKYNPGMQVIIEELPNVVYPDTQSRLPTFSLRQIMGSNLTKFYRYNGSLTTPPCSETVSWLLLADPIEISDAQMLAFQTSLLDGHFATMGDNYRPVCPLNGRRVYANHPSLRYAPVPTTNYIGGLALPLG